MQLKIFKDYQDLSHAAAMMIIDCVKDKPDAVLCFATGDSPKLTYEEVVRVANNDKVDFTKCFFIGLDEWFGVPPENSGSCHYFLHHYLFKPLGVERRQIHLFDSMTDDEPNECRRMNDVVEKKGIDLMLVGVGMNGHIGFNEPGTDNQSTAHIAELDDITKNVGQKYFEQAVAINKGMTLGLKQVMNAGMLMMLANGKKKAPVIRRTAQEEISNAFPATLIREHKNSFLLVDSEAASELEKQHS